MPSSTQGRTDESRKTSVRLPADLLDAVQEAVERGDAETQTALIERALRRELAVLRRERLRSAYEAASRDEAFMQAMESTTRDFEGTTADGLD